MAQTNVLEYKCPCCNAPLVFGANVQKLTCEYCDNTFDLETVMAYNQQPENGEQFQWEEASQSDWSQEEAEHLQVFQCPACGGELVTDENTAASFCPYCENPAILPARLAGGLKPDAILPFQTQKKDAQEALLRLCRGKVLLPKGFADEQRLEKITGIYVPFWLYDCDAQVDATYQATRVHRWSDAKFDYVKTEHFRLTRQAEGQFSGIPMDGSSKMEDSFMESIEPFDYDQLEDFQMGYLSGFLADKYDVPAENGKERIRQRVDTTMSDHLQESLFGFDTVTPVGKHLSVGHTRSRYVLLPVWMLNTNYRGKVYTFAMNGQTGKITGSLPICPKRTAAWFAGIAGAVAALALVVQLLML